jgi:hypothetical protein
MSNQILPGLNLSDVQSMRRVLKALEQNLMSRDADHSQPSLTSGMTSAEKTATLWILNTIRITPGHSILLDAAIRFIDAGTEGVDTEGMLDAAQDLNQLAATLVLERPSDNKHAYSTAVANWRVKYPLKVSHAAHGRYLQQVVCIHLTLFV